MPDQPESPAKIEYDRLITFFEKLFASFEKLLKVAAWVLALILGVAAAFLWSNIRDVRGQAETSIKATQDAATQQIVAIGQAAQATAKQEAQKAIDAAFEKQNVQRLIESTAQRKVDAAVEAAVKKDLGAKVDAFRDFVIEIGEINNHGAQLRLDFRSGLDYLLKARQNPDPAIRAYASSTLTLIAADYEYAVTRLPIPMEGFLGTTTVPEQFSPKQLMQFIRTTEDPRGPTKIAIAFATMKKKVAWDVSIFDIPGAEKWCASHKPKCDE